MTVAVVATAEAEAAAIETSEQWQALVMCAWAAW